MTTAPDPVLAGEPGSDVVEAGRDRTLTRRLWVHAVLLAVVLAGLVVVVDNGSIAFVDEGVYSYQAANLADGSWASPRPLPEIDGHGANSVFGDATIRGDDWIPYARQPLYPLLLAPLSRLGGYGALLALSVFGTWVAALSAAGIAERIDRRAAIPTLWLTGIGTPLLFDANLVLAHSLAAGFTGVCAYALLRSWQSRSPGSPTARWRSFVGLTALAVVSAVVVVLVRSEGAIVVGSIAAIGVLVGLGIGRRVLRPDRWRIGSSVAVGVSGVLAFVANDRWAAHILAGGGPTSAGIDRAHDPLQQAWVSLIRPWSDELAHPSPALALVVVLVVVAAVLHRMWPVRPFLTTGVLCAASVAAVGAQFGQPSIVTGLVATIPVVVLGLLLIGRVELKQAPVQLLVGAAAAAVLGILWFAYGSGGASEWGGRFFHVVISLVVPVAVLGLMRFLDALPQLHRMACGAALVVMVVSIAVLSLRTVAVLRERNRAIVRGAVEAAAPDRSVILTAPELSTGLPRLFWAEVRDGRPVINGGDLFTYTKVLRRAVDHGVRSFEVVTKMDRADVHQDVDVAFHGAPGPGRWQVTGARMLGDSGYWAYTVEPAAG